MKDFDKNMSKLENQKTLQENDICENLIKRFKSGKEKPNPESFKSNFSEENH